MIFITKRKKLLCYYILSTKKNCFHFGHEGIYAISENYRGISEIVLIKPPKPLRFLCFSVSSFTRVFPLREAEAPSFLILSATMATQIFSRTFPKSLTLASFFCRSLSTTTPSVTSLSVAARSPLSAVSFLRRLRPLAVASADIRRRILPSSSSLRAFSTRATSSSLNDPNPNWSNRPPKETILLDGCDFEHWLVVMEKPEGDPTRDEIIDSYIKTLAQVVGRYGLSSFPFFSSLKMIDQ